MAFTYNADAERFRFILRFRHTIFPMVFSEPMFWILMVWHFFILHTQRALLDEGDSLPKLEWKASIMLSSLLTFFVVFYGGNCYSRYFTFYGSCTGMVGALGEWAYLIRAHFDASPPTVKWNMLRLMLASMEIQLANLGGADDQGGKGISDEEWNMIRRHGFLSRDEIARLQRYKGSKSFLPAVWALAEVRTALKAKLARVTKPQPQQPLPPSDLVPPETKGPAKKPSAAAEHEAESALLHTPAAMHVFEDFENCVLKLKGHCGASLNLLKMPVPFAYFHVLKFLLIVSLAMTSYALVELEDAQYALSVIVFTLICIITIGLQSVAVAMSDPFGGDDLDFDLKGLLKSAYENAVALITDQRVALHDRLPPGVEPEHNPLADSESSKRARMWANISEGHDEANLGPAQALPPKSSPGKYARLET